MKSNIHSVALYESTLINLRILRSLEPGFRLDTTQRLFRVHQKRNNLVPTWLQRTYDRIHKRFDRGPQKPANYLQNRSDNDGFD
jgi:hypothetical protein